MNPLKLGLAALIQLLVPVLAVAQMTPRPKKLIVAGWDMPNTDQLRRDLAKMETLPFDGTTVWLTPKGPLPPGYNGTPPRTAFSRQPWKREWFESAIADLRAVKAAKTRLTDNFVRMNANPGDVDWFDDAGWKEIVDHFRIAAWVAKEGGAKGIFFDPVPYTKPWVPFDYKAQPKAAKHSVDEYRAKARQRGRELMTAIADEYPGITLFTFYMNIYLVDGPPGTRPSSVGLSVKYQQRALFFNNDGLYPAFIDGWLDALPPEAKFVDGNETGYHYSMEEQFYKAAALIKGDAQALVSPANRARYRNQVQVGVGVYLDAHVPAIKSMYLLKGAGTELLKRNLDSALRSVDE